MSSLGHPQAGDDGWASVLDKIFSSVDQGYWEDCTYANGTGAVSTAATYASATTFTVTGDQTTVYVTARRLRIVHAGGTSYCEVLSSAYVSPTTTVTITGITSGPTTMTTPITSVAVSLVFRGITGNELHSDSTASLGADVNFSSGVAGTYNDGPSVALPSGRHFVVGTVSLIGGVNALNYGTAKLWDGTTLLDSCEGLIGIAGQAVETALTLSGTATSSATWKISVAATVASTANLIKAATVNGGTPAKASTINAVKIL